MSVFEGVILGLIQGFTEFLPISSSGHLVLFQKLFNLKEGVLLFDVAVHFSTLLAVLSIMREDLIKIIKKPLDKLPLLIVAGTIPTVIIGFTFKDFFENSLKSGKTLGLEFILTGLVLWYAEGASGRNKGVNSTSFLDASIIGVTQGIAILPAVSRSGLTLAGGLFRGLNRQFALKFSFLLSIPAILGPSLIDAYKLTKGAEAGINGGPLIAGMVAAGVAGYIAIKIMLKIFSKLSLKFFSYYVFALGGFVIIEQLFSGKIFGRLL